LNVDGSFTYTPDSGYAGPDSFIYTAGDGSLTSLPATVMLEITAAKNAPPRIVSGEPGFTSRVIGKRVLGTHIALGADLDGDGDMDITATDYDNGRVVWYENEDGSYTERVLDGDLEGAYPASLPTWMATATPMYWLPAIWPIHSCGIATMAAAISPESISTPLPTARIRSLELTWTEMATSIW
jgi:hypothetical protein